MQYLCIKTGWALLPECWPSYSILCNEVPLLWKAIQILTITRPWDWLWESMPQPLFFPSSVPSYRGTWELPETGRWTFWGPIIPSFGPVAGASFLLRVSPAQLCLALLPCPTRCCWVGALPGIDQLSEEPYIICVWAQAGGHEWELVPGGYIPIPGSVKQGKNSLLDGWFAPLPPP